MTNSNSSVKEFIKQNTKILLGKNNDVIVSISNINFQHYLSIGEDGVPLYSQFPPNSSFYFQYNPQTRKYEPNQSVYAWSNEELMKYALYDNNLIAKELTEKELIDRKLGDLLQRERAKLKEARQQNSAYGQAYPPNIDKSDQSEYNTMGDSNPTLNKAVNNVSNAMYAMADTASNFAYDTATDPMTYGGGVILGGIGKAKRYPDGVTLAGLGRGNFGKQKHKLSSPNPIHDKYLRKAYEDIKEGKGIPNMDEFGNQKIYQGRERPEWQGAKEWLIEDKHGGTSSNRRILEKESGEMGFVIDHDYKSITRFPSPWYQDGGKNLNRVKPQ